MELYILWLTILRIVLWQKLQTWKWLINNCWVMKYNNKAYFRGDTADVETGAAQGRVLLHAHGLQAKLGALINPIFILNSYASKIVFARL